MPELSKIGEGDKVFAYSKSLNNYGFVSVENLKSKGYACRRWNVNHSSPVGEVYGNIDYLRELPGLLGLGCYLVDNARNMRKLSPTNHYKFADGSAASIDGSMGDYMWCWATPFYYSWWREGDYYYEAVALTPIEGRQNYYIPVGGISALGSGVIDRTNDKLVSVVNNAAQYRGGNNDSTRDNTYKTLLGRVASNYNITEFRRLARNKGEGWEAGWFVHNAVVGILTRLILGTRHIQSAFNSSKDANGLYQGGLGNGVTVDGSKWDQNFNYYPFLPTSAGVELADGVGVSNQIVQDASGNTLFTVGVPVFFGLKNFYAYIGCIEGGSLISKRADGSGDYYVANSLYTGYTVNGTSGMTKATTIPANNPMGWKYITEISMQNLCHAPTVAEGSSSTYYADGYYNDNAVSGLRVPFRRGDASHGGACGPECLIANHAVSSASASWSSPLCFTKEDIAPFPC
ncbi:MAG: hypothetical protein RR202_10625 [Bacteroidales bacterium]